MHQHAAQRMPCANESPFWFFVQSDFVLEVGAAATKHVLCVTDCSGNFGLHHYIELIVFAAMERL